jgi:hypothetical protein
VLFDSLRKNSSLNTLTGAGAGPENTKYCDRCKETTTHRVNQPAAAPGGQEHVSELYGLRWSDE